MIMDVNKANRMKLTALEEDILHVIATRFPYPLAMVIGVYGEVKSYDKTIAVLEYASKNAVSVGGVLHALDILTK